jgi:hypothetical protein
MCLEKISNITNILSQGKSGHWPRLETSISEANQKSYRLSEPALYRTTSFTSSKTSSRIVSKVEIIRTARIIGNKSKSWLHHNILSAWV